MAPYLLFAFFLIAILTTLFPGRKRWLSYAKLAEFKPDEKILHEEANVRIIDDISGLEHIGHGEQGKAWGKANVKITNLRILSFQGKIPIGIANYYIREEMPKSWLHFYRGFLINIHKEDILFGIDNKGNEYLEFTSKKDRSIIRRRYFFKNISAAKNIFSK